ncbi:hypothetical protein [Actinomadura sp. 7K507]|uniref:hypothetical protein n=1 Tax=Actinomadura sp. 7K507 TaxID=2530365 RepID=UPI001049C6B9|nr:hypothetical protein [Actinomadura sp. 7K507]TDC81583.1 hypothetical protein E1285_32320 [Actinomadura sp. 7K507]
MHAEAMMSEERAISVVEFDRRMQCAVWGLAVTMALSGWSAAPWVVEDDESYVLWELGYVEELGLFGALLSSLMTVTLVLGVAASAAASRPVARAAWIAGLATALTTFAFMSDGFGLKTGYGADYAPTIAGAFTVVFFVVSWSATDPRRSAKPSKTTKISRWPKWTDPSFGAWADRSFGTIDKRYFRDR